MAGDRDGGCPGVTRGVLGSLDGSRSVVRFVDGADEFVKPRNVGLMFFHDAPEKIFPGTQIEFVHFPEGVAGTRIDERIFGGPLHQQLRDALRHMRNSVVEERVTKMPDRAEADRIFNYPFAAIEESLVNAVYHRGYDQREPIEVRINPDRIEIVSYPGPDPSIRLESLRNRRFVARRYRNRRIGDFLKELEMMEGRSTGIPIIYDAMEKNGSPPPRFETDEGRTYFLVELPVHPSFAPVEAPVKAPVALSETERQILRLCLNHPLSKQEIV
jgi:ATP-dependent DNA helicase RecG